MPSQHVCLTCGRPIYMVAKGSGVTWKHANGGGTGRTPKRLRHVPVQISREDYDTAFAPETPPNVARSILERTRGR